MDTRLIDPKYHTLVRKRTVNAALDYRFLESVIRDVVQKHYPNITTITKLTHVDYKRRVGKRNSAFIYGYTVYAQTADGSSVMKELIYNAHTDGSRARAFANIQGLIAAGFNQGPYHIIQPLEFFDDIQGFIYEAVPGKTLLQYLRAQTPLAELMTLLTTIAGWIKKLHTFAVPEDLYQTIPVFDSKNLNIPIDTITSTVRRDSREQAKKLIAFFEAFFPLEQRLVTDVRHRIVYGDLHPENIITDNPLKPELTMVDFTDVSRGDQLRDIGTFIQQLWFMGRNFYPVTAIEDLRLHFMQQYFGQPLDSLSKEIFARINLYQAWNSIRNFVWLFYTATEEEKPYGLLEDAWLYLSLAKEQQPRIAIEHSL